MSVRAAGTAWPLAAALGAPAAVAGSHAVEPDHTGERAVAWYDAHAFRARE